MRILVVSDTHGNDSSLRRAILAQPKAEVVIHLGDGEEELLRAKRAFPEKMFLAVRGNCEAEVDQMVLPFPCMADYAVLLVDGVTFYLTHGHHANPENLPPLTAGSVFLSGHTHVKRDEVIGGIRCLNPGSVSIPKDGSHSYLLYEDGTFTFRTWED